MPDVTLIDAHPRPIAVVRAVMEISKWPAQFRNSLDKVYEAAKAGRFRQTGHNVMVYRPRADKFTDIECGFEIDRRFEPIGDLVYSETPSGAALTAAHIGPYQHLGATHKAIVAWARQYKRQLTGVCWEIYGDWEPDDSKLRTDLFYQLRPQPAST